MERHHNKLQWKVGRTKPAEQIYCSLATPHSYKAPLPCPCHLPHDSTSPKKRINTKGREGCVVCVGKRSPGNTSPLSWSLAPSLQKDTCLSWPQIKKDAAPRVRVDHWLNFFFFGHGRSLLWCVTLHRRTNRSSFPLLLNPPRVSFLANTFTQ